MRNKKYSLTNEEAKHIGRKLTQQKRYRLNEEEEEEILRLRGETKSEINQHDTISSMSALKTNGELMDIDEFCEFYGIDRNDVRSYKLVSHTGNAYYNVSSKNIENDDVNGYIDFIKDSIKKDLDSIVYKSVKSKSKDKVIVVSIADLHFGAYIDNLSKTKPYSISILADLLSESADLINEYEAKEVHVRVLGDLIESFTGLNHINSWKGLHKGMIGAEAVKLTTKVLHDNFFNRIKNLKKIGIIAGNHDRVTSNKAEDSDGDAANLIAWGLELIGYNVEFNPFVLTEVIDGINYIDLHGHDFISRKSTKDICWDYGKQGVFNFIREGHLHSIIEKLSVTQINKFQTVKDDAIDHRRMNIPSFFTGNSYSERLGYTSNSGFIVSYNNGKGVPNVDFKSL